MSRYLGLSLLAVAAITALLATGSTASARHHSGGRNGGSGGIFGGSHGGNGSHGGRGSHSGRGSHGGFGGLFHRGSSNGSTGGHGGSAGGHGSHGGAPTNCGCEGSTAAYEGNHEHGDDESSARDNDGNDRVMEARRETRRVEGRDVNSSSSNVRGQDSSQRDEAQISGAAPVESANESANVEGEQTKAQEGTNDNNSEQTKGTKEDRNNPTPGNADQSK